MWSVLVELTKKKVKNYLYVWELREIKTEWLLIFSWLYFSLISNEKMKGKESRSHIHLCSFILTILSYSIWTNNKDKELCGIGSKTYSSFRTKLSFQRVPTHEGEFSQSLDVQLERERDSERLKGRRVPGNINTRVPYNVLNRHLPRRSLSSVCIIQIEETSVRTS